MGILDLVGYGPEDIYSTDDFETTLYKEAKIKIYHAKTQKDIDSIKIKFDKQLLFWSFTKNTKQTYPIFILRESSSL